MFWLHNLDHRSQQISAWWSHRDLQEPPAFRVEVFIIGMANLKVVPGLEGGGGHIAALRRHEGHLRPPLLETSQVEGEEIV